MYISLDKNTTILEQYKIRTSSLLGFPLSPDHFVHIVGGGFAGLVLGFYCKKNNVPFTIYEKNPRVGGLLGTVTLSNGIAEKAANGFLWSAALEEIADEIGVTILPPKKEARARYLVRNGKLKRFPLSLSEALGTLMRMLRSHKHKPRTLADFGNTFLGKSVTKQVLAPAFAGIYAADIERLSFPGTMGKLAAALNDTPYLWKAFRKLRSGRDKGKPTPKGTHSFLGGVQTFVDALEKHLQPYIQYNREITSLGNLAEQVVLTTPAYISASHTSDKLQSLLKAVEYTPLVTATLIFKAKNLPKLKTGFGCLIPRNEGYTILGVLFNSHIFEGRVKDDSLVSVTTIMRDEGDGQIISLTENELLEKYILHDLKNLLGRNAPALESQVTKWRKGIPIYSPELYHAWHEIDTLLKSDSPQLRLFGNYTGQISLRGMAEVASKIF